MSQALPLPELEPLRPAARRTLALRLVAAALFGALFVIVVLLLPQPQLSAGSTAPHSDGIMVVDVSGSTAGIYSEIAADLDALARSHGGHGHYGVVLFADHSFEFLPPGASAQEIERVAYYFHHPALQPAHPGVPTTIPPGASPGAIASQGQTPLEPWLGYGSGTSIVTGLSLAALELVDRHLSAPLILVSDLDDDFRSKPQVQQLALSLVHYHLPLWVAPLSTAKAANLTFYNDLPGGVTFTSASRLGADQSKEPGSPPPKTGIPFPLASLLAAAALALIVALFLVHRQRLDWREA